MYNFDLVQIEDEINDERGTRFTVIGLKYYETSSL